MTQNKVVGGVMMIAGVALVWFGYKHFAKQVIMPVKARTYFSKHSVFTGMALIAIGLFGMYGSVTGLLAPMLAALFDPTALTP